MFLVHLVTAGHAARHDPRVSALVWCNSRSFTMVGQFKRGCRQFDKTTYCKELRNYPLDIRNCLAYI